MRFVSLEVLNNFLTRDLVQNNFSLSPTDFVASPAYGVGSTEKAGRTRAVGRAAGWLACLSTAWGGPSVL